MRAAILWLCVCGLTLADTLVVVTSDRCEPCRHLKRDLKAQPALYVPHTLVVVEGREAVRKWHVTSVPTLIRVRDGREVARHVGYTGPADVVGLLED